MIGEQTNLISKRDNKVQPLRPESIAGIQFEWENVIKRRGPKKLDRFETLSTFFFDEEEKQNQPKTQQTITSRLGYK